MNAFLLAWKNLKHRPLNTGFNLLLLILAGGLITLGLLVNSQFENHFNKNLGKTDLILAAKGSPLQSVLCNLFHIDFPTGNIPLSDCKVFLKENHPIIKSALPIALGDQYAGFRLVGTTDTYGHWTPIQFETGQWFDKDFHAVIGSEAAIKTGLKINDTFISGHGIQTENVNEHQHDEHQFKVCGILKPTGTITDQLILISISSYWALHHDEVAEDHSAHHHGPACLTNQDLINTEGEITSVLLEFKGTNIQSLNFGRSINENTEMMAASPAIELNRLYELTGTATELLSFVLIALVLISLLSLFISLWQAMEERKYEMALLRFAGASPSKIIRWTLSEAALLSFSGVTIGMILAHILLAIVNPLLKLEMKYGIRADVLFPGEWLIPIAACLLGILAALIPAVRAMKTDIHHTLSSE
ncbi:MAG: ABC transporter permease [Saprospiraceae bacterium]|nr:ABC transporter permease [Saprospiraceae bacterium]